MAQNDVTNVMISRAIVKFATFDMGFMAKVNCSGMKLKTIEKRIEALGDLLVDELIIGLEGPIGLEFEEINVEIYQKLMPWFTTGSIPLTQQSLTASMLALAGAVNIHPEVNGATLTRDLNLLKAVPHITHVDWNGKSKVKLSASLQYYPDPTVLASTGIASYGYIGAPPA